MKKIKLDSLKIWTVPNSIERLEMTDEEYFSSKYSKYISNSRLKYINPEQEGNPLLYKQGGNQESSGSLELGSSVHQLFLQKELFQLREGLQKPTAKLGKFVDKIKEYRLKGESIQSSLSKAAIAADYYATSLTQNRIRAAMEKGLYYYLHSKDLKEGDIILSDKDTQTCKNCIESLTSHKRINSLVHPTDMFGNPVKSFNEDVILMKVRVYSGNRFKTLKLKMKADNWSVDEVEKKLVLNDLKTTGKPIGYFMQEYGSFIKYHYSRQSAMYLWLLKEYCKQVYNFDKTWSSEVNMMVVETILNNNAGCFKVNNDFLRSGEKEFIKLLKMVGYYEIFGYEEEVEFV